MESTISEPMFTRKAIVALIVPLILEQILNVFVGMADSIMVSSVGEAAVSGISLVDSINFLLIQLFAALATGGAVICSQYIGKGDRISAGSAAKQLIYFSVAFAALLGAIAIIFNHLLLELIFGNVEEAVMQNAQTYFWLSALSYPFLALYNAGAALFRSMNKSRITLYISALVNLINICGNALLIYGFKMGVAGAATATLLARAAGGIVIFMLLCKPRQPIHVDEPFRYRPEGAMLGRILKIGIPTGTENSLFQLGKLLLSHLVATFGTAAISANAISNTLVSMSNVPGAAIGLGLVTIVGQCMGARQPKQAMQYTKKMLLLTFLLMNILNVIMYVGAAQLAGIYHLSQEATDAAVEIIRSFALAAAIFWPLSFTIPNALRAAGDAKFTMFVSITSMFLFRVILAYVLAYNTDLGVITVWLGMYADWVVRAVLYTVRLIRGKWKNIRLV